MSMVVLMSQWIFFSLSFSLILYVFTMGFTYLPHSVLSLQKIQQWVFIQPPQFSSNSVEKCSLEENWFGVISMQLPAMQVSTDHLLRLLLVIPSHSLLLCNDTLCLNLGLQLLDKNTIVKLIQGGGYYLNMCGYKPGKLYIRSLKFRTLISIAIMGMSWLDPALWK